jgi:membrane protein DedA with SNARE-associated domain
VHGDGCWFVFAAVALQALGVPLPGTTALVAAAVYASTTHRLPIAWIIVAGAAGALVGTSAGYGIGRWGGERLLARLGRRAGHERIARVRAELAARGAVWLILARFITGLRNLAGLVAGASGMPVRPFLLASAGASVLWATITGLEYYFFGAAIVGAPTWLQVVLVAVGLVVTALVLRAVGSASRRAPTQP